MTGAIILDAQGLKCPLPVLRARKAIRGVPAGGLLQVLATDPAAPQDFRAFCRETGHIFVDLVDAGGVCTITIRKKG
jgi:tRNA 2-thiouridine synthesizing protein A